MSVKFDKFIEELGALCKKYDVTITSSLYDPVAVFDKYETDGEVSQIQDRTRPDENEQN